MLQESMKSTGAVVMGRHAYDMAQGDFTGYEFQVPIFVLTHHAPETVAKGENDRLRFTLDIIGKSLTEYHTSIAFSTRVNIWYHGIY